MKLSKIVILGAELHRIVLILIISEIIKEAEIEVLLGDESDWKDIQEKIKGIHSIKYILFPETENVFLEKPIIGIFKKQLESNYIKEPIETGLENNAYIGIILNLKLVILLNTMHASIYLDKSSIRNFLFLYSLLSLSSIFKLLI